MSVAPTRIGGGIAVPWTVAVLLVVAIAAALRVTPLVDWEGGDAENYACIAWRLAQGESVVGQYAGPPHEPGESMGPRAFAIRPAVTVPASWGLAILPPGPWAFSLFPLALGLSEVVLAMLFGRRLWGPKAGLLSGLLVACLPLAVSEARALRADLPAGVLLGWGVFALWVAAMTRSTRRALAAGTASGLLLGASWLAKETVVLAVPALAVLAALAIRREGRRAWPGLLACGLTGLAVLGAEAATYAAKTGDPLFRFHELARNFEQCRENFFYADSPAHGWPEGEYASAVITRLALAGPKQLLFARPTLGIGCLALVAGLVLWRRRDAVVAPILAWLVLLGLAFNFGSTSLSEYRPVVPASTYFYPIVLPACLLCGAAAARWGGSRVVRASFAIFMAISGLLSLAVNLRDREPMAAIRACSAAVPEGARVAIDFRGATSWAYARTGTPAVGGATRSLDEIQGPGEVDFVVVRRETLAFLKANYRYEPPAWLGELDRSDRADRTFEAHDMVVYRTSTIDR